MKERRVAFFAEYIPFFFAALPIILEIKRNNIPFDVYVPTPNANLDFIINGHNSLKSAFESRGIEVLSDFPEGVKYDVVYSMYHGYHEMLARSNDIRYNVRLDYHGNAGSKPEMFTPAHYCYYDYFLALSEHNSSLSLGHLKSITIGNIKLANYKRTRAVPQGKKTILYLPTWGSGGEAINSVNDSTIRKLLSLQSKYNIATKMHGHTAYSDKLACQRILFDDFNHVYDVNTPIAEILNDADVVLSDRSGAAFDAIAGDVPLALFGFGKPIYYGGKLCLPQQLIEDDIIPGTNDIDKLEEIIEKALSPEYFEKQQKLKKEMFPFEGQACLDAFMKFQDDLFNDRVDPWYIAARRHIREEHIKNLQELSDLHSEIWAVRGELAVARAKFEQVLNSKSWKITKPIRALNKIFKSDWKPLE
ncbi:MAG: CDP-glycerol glycerophosphotransferase family protein [Oscillospiraceae bacterium]|nr:CDP-glycerol glycerophosphotransferase family protein [Oscillospiraceae bacterium]